MSYDSVNRENSSWSPIRIKLLILIFSSLIFQIIVLSITANSATAQTITPAADGTNTLVNQNGNLINITGGTLSGNGANLFHSFQKFGLNQNQIANFLSNPHIQNILGRVVGGDPSRINGLIQVTGGNSNLYLLNPAGIVFGPNASLNVPANFTATTANSISIGNDWFNVFGNNNYNTLIGTPTTFKFDASQPGSIVNLGNLAAGKDLTILGGTVVNTGSLTAQNGNITVASVPGENLIRISQTGNLLSLEIPADAAQSININIPTLAKLLTGAGLENSNLTVNDEQVQLTNSGINVNAGDVVAKGIEANNATISAKNNLILPESRLVTIGNLKLEAKNTVIARDSITEPFTAQTGGNLYIQGDKNVDILALNHPQIPFVSGGDMTLVSDGVVSGDAHFTSGGEFKIQNLSGSPGNFESKYDPIITSKQEVEFGNYTGASLKVEAQGSIRGGDITIISADTSNSIPDNDPDKTILTTSRAVILRAGVNISSPDPLPNNVGGTDFKENPVSPLLPTIEVGNINTSSNEIGNNKSGPIILSASGDISTNDLNSSTSASGVNGGTIQLTATSGDVGTGNLNSSSIDGTGGDIKLTAGGSFGLIFIGNKVTTSGKTAGGNITFDVGDVIVQNGATTIDTGTGTNAGDVTFNQRLNGANDLTINAGEGNVTFNGEVGSTEFLNNLTVTARNTKVGNYVGASNINFNSDVILNGSESSVNMQTTSGDITFNGKVDGGKNLILDPARKVNFNQNVGSGTALSSLTVKSAVILPDNNTNITIKTNNGDIKFDNGVDGQSNLTLEAGIGKINLGSVGDTKHLNSLNVNSASQINVNSYIETKENLTFNQPVNLTGDVTIVATNKNITFNNALNGDHDLIVNAGSNGTIDFKGDVGGNSNPLGSLTVQSKANVGNFIATTGQITFEQAVTLNGTGTDATIQTNNSDITFSNTLDGERNLTLNSGNGTVNFKDAVGATQPLDTLNINTAKQINIASYVATKNDLTFTRPVNLTSNTTINTDTGKKVVFNETLNGNQYDLTLNTDEIDFNSSKPATGGNVLKLQPVTTNGPINVGGAGDTIGNLDITQGDLTALKGSFQEIVVGSENSNAETNITGDITTNQPSLTFQNPVSLAAGSNVNISTGNADISFSNKVDGNGTLNLAAGTGKIDFG
ncbi:MAG TPA: filamentous hemagglutinin N-terminal domain-containing protein, partial [Nostocaceae cyanobacterium]|nr:filamentous hemagglutinin N-terminal domain-containing protein [Nostocaceae cyanobacterium]